VWFRAGALSFLKREDGALCISGTVKKKERFRQRRRTFRDISLYFEKNREISRRKGQKLLEISRFFSFFHDVNFLQKFPI